MNNIDKPTDPVQPLEKINSAAKIGLIYFNLVELLRLGQLIKFGLPSLVKGANNAI